MHYIEQISINGEFVTPHGTERFDLYNPATRKKSTVLMQTPAACSRTLMTF